MRTLLEIFDFEGIMEAFESPGMIAGLIAGALLSALACCPSARASHALAAHGHTLAAVAALVHRTFG